MNEVWAVDEVWGLDRVWPVNYTNVTLEDYLLQKRGPQTLALQVVVPITVVYAVIFLSGVVGNVVICSVIVTNRSLHTNTNYYLFSLAVSDMALLLLGLPNDLSVFWQQYPWRLGEPICKLRALISEMTSYTSVLTIVAFSTERYLAICHPLLSYTMSGFGRAVRIISVLWLISFISALPFAIFTKVNYITYPPDSDEIVEESAFCGMLEDNIPKDLPIYELSFFIFFFIPLCIIIVLYIKIGLQIRTNSLGNKFQGTVHGETKKVQSRKTIIRMLVAVVVTFFLCWAPYHAQRLHYLYGRGGEWYYSVNEWLYYLAGCFYYLSSTINPVLYNLMSAKYREGFRRTFCCEQRRYSVVPTSSDVKRDSVDGEGLRRTFCGEQRRYSVVPTSSDVKRDSADGDADVKWKKQPTRDVVVTITPDPDEGCTTVTTETSFWPHTKLSVTMKRARPAHDTICVQMETSL